MLVHSETEALVLMPLNVVSVMPPELAEASPKLWQALLTEARALPNDLKTLPLADARALWLRSIAEARSQNREGVVGFESAARIFARQLSGFAEFGSILIPTLFVQQAPIEGLTASWDDIEESLELPGAVDPEDLRIEGHASAASLHVAILDEAGGTIFEAQRGIELIVVVRRALDGPSRFELAPRDEIFEDRAALARAITPLLAPFGAAREPGID